MLRDRVGVFFTVDINIMGHFTAHFDFLTHFTRKVNLSGINSARAVDSVSACVQIDIS
jgi:hypothetical protein